jgi:hypothetical protein
VQPSFDHRFGTIALASSALNGVDRGGSCQLSQHVSPVVGAFIALRSAVPLVGVYRNETPCYQKKKRPEATTGRLIMHNGDKAAVPRINNECLVWSTELN